MEPISLVTGTPGAGKTLWCIQFVENERLTRGIPVYYANIPEVQLDWTRIEAEKWHELNGPAIVVIDEAHRVFPQRPPGSKAPDHVAPFDQLRHKALEVVLVTQHPKELDHYIKRRIGFHLHLDRVFGQPYAKTCQWEKIAEDPSDYHLRQEALKGQFRYPRNFFGAYKSATMHVAPRRFPWKKLAFSLGLPAVVLVAGVFAFFSTGIGKSLVSDPEPVPTAVPVTSLPSIASAQALADPTREAASWSSRWVERVGGLAYSASLYDSLITAASFPKVAGCSRWDFGHRVRCYCNDQQGNILHSMPLDQCIHFVANGWFDFSLADTADEPGGAGGPYPVGGASSEAHGGRPPGPPAPALALGGAQ